MTALAEAATALDAGDRLSALDALLRAWRAERVPAIADAIDVVSADVARALPKFPKQRSTKEMSQRWHDTCERGRAADVPRLLAEVATQYMTTSAVQLQVERLARRFPDDPRVAKHLMWMLCGGFRWAPKPLWPLVFKLLTALKDGRGLPALEKQRVRPKEAHPRVFHDDFYERMEKLAAVLAVPPPPLDVAAQTLVARITQQASDFAKGPRLSSDAVEAHAPDVPATKTGQSETELLAMVWSAPDDDAARLVYADALSERGDERGEFITLQHKPAPTKKELTRMRALLRLHLAEWLGPLEPAVVIKTARFERGFLSACTTRFSSPEQREALAAHPGWATLREVTTDDARVVRLATSLRVLGEAKATLLRQLCAGAPLQVETLTMRLTATMNAAMREQLTGLRAFPRLTDLTCTLTQAMSMDAGDWLWLFQPLFDKLRHFRLSKDPGYREHFDLKSWLPHFPPSLTAELANGDVGVIVTRGDKGLRLAVKAQHLAADFGILPTLSELDAKQIEHVDVTLMPWLAGKTAPLDAALARFKSSAVHVPAKP